MTWYAVDGMDGCGKNTVSHIIKEKLESEGRTVLEITHPNRKTISGRLSKRYLCVHNRMGQICSAVFYNLDLIQSVFRMKRIGKKYDDVIFVRYILVAAYLPKGVVRMVYDMLEHILPVPEVKIYVDNKPGICMERIVERGEELEIYENETVLNETREKMKLITESWITIDNSGTLEETVKKIDGMMKHG